ncbi:uncharacterized protein LOC111911237 isoform X1 [Lactuca sativa]|uniref:uncharacterized protein LOC111911237 isoform X1 n=1 Tax=Lactuca sativa TaxID=4236 RepID=UPI000CD9D4A5|nr:uncharacterized protein LOC111911237 isoform X1 [Lactuca sativa]
MGLFDSTLVTPFTASNTYIPLILCIYFLQFRSPPPFSPVVIFSHKSFDSKLEKGVHNRSSPSCREDFQIQRKASEQQFRSYSQQALCLHRTCNTQPLLFPCSFSDTEHHQVRFLSNPLIISIVDWCLGFVTCLILGGFDVYRAHFSSISLGVIFFLLLIYLIDFSFFFHASSVWSDYLHVLIFFFAPCFCGCSEANRRIFDSDIPYNIIFTFHKFILTYVVFPTQVTSFQFATLCLILENEVCYSNKGESGYCIEECQDTTMNEL